MITTNQLTKWGYEQLSTKYTDFAKQRLWIFNKGLRDFKSLRFGVFFCVCVETTNCKYHKDKISYKKEDIGTSGTNPCHNNCSASHNLSPLLYPFSPYKSLSQHTPLCNQRKPSIPKTNHPCTYPTLILLVPWCSPDVQGLVYSFYFFNLQVFFI